MNKFTFRFLAAAIVATLSAGFTSCSDDDDDFIKEPTVKLLSFNGSQNILAGPTSYGENCYATYSAGPRYTQAEFGVEEGVTLCFGLNRSPYYGNEFDFSAGGIALSQWNYRHDVGNHPAGWWKTYENQMSVYNVSSPSGQNDRAGVDGDNTFLVVYSNTDHTDASYNAAPASMQFSANKEYVIDAIYICPTSYMYAAITEGSPFSLQPNVPLKDQHGWFKLMIFGYDAAGQPTNGGYPVEYMLCDYRSGSEIVTNLPVSWTAISLEKLGMVNRLEFAFDGSDKGEWGLNTPPYICVDQMLINLIKMN